MKFVLWSFVGLLLAISGFSLGLIIHQKVHGFANPGRVADSDVLTVTFLMSVALSLEAFCFVKAKNVAAEIS